MFHGSGRPQPGRLLRQVVPNPFLPADRQRAEEEERSVIFYSHVDHAHVSIPEPAGPERLERDRTPCCAHMQRNSPYSRRWPATRPAGDSRREETARLRRRDVNDVKGRATSSTRPHPRPYTPKRRRPRDSGSGQPRAHSTVPRSDTLRGVSRPSGSGTLRAWVFHTPRSVWSAGAGRR